MSNALHAWLPTLSQHFLLGSLAVLVYILSTRLRREQRAPTTAIAWVLTLVTFPYLALPAYLMFGRRKLRPEAPPRIAPTGRPTHWAALLLQGLGLQPPSFCNVRLHLDGRSAAKALFEVIDGAQHRLDVCTFIIGDDPLGQAVVERLAARAREGIQVRVLLDGFGALRLSRRVFDELRAAGGDVAVFRPLFSLRRNGPRNLRNHRKFTIADDRWLWSGGRNLAGEYFEGNATQPGGWPDLSFDLRGGVADEAARQFEADWSSLRGHTARLIEPTEGAQAEPSSLSAPDTMRPDATSGSRATSERAPGWAQFVPSGPDQAEDTAHALLIDGCYRAERRVLAITPYFVPGDALRDALRLAARRGVEVTLVVPQRSNHRLADFARARAMRDLAAAGVRFRMLDFMAHAKAVVLDDEWALVGSINLDQRSLLLNHEASVLFYDAAQIEPVARWIDATAAGAATYRPRPPGLLRDLGEGLLLAFAFQL